MSKVIIWVRLLRLPYKYFLKGLMRRSTKLLSDVVRIDYNTNTAKRGKFTRLAMVDNLTKLLFSCIRINGFSWVI